MVAVDSYSTSVIPVYGESIVTMDGVEHSSVLRNKGTVTFTPNPQTDTATEELCAVLLSGIMQVQYYCLQRNAEIIASMKLSGVSAQHLGRIRFGGRKWNEIPAITLTEL